MTKRDRANIAPVLAELVVPIDAIEPHPWNTYRDHDLGAIGESYVRFGQLSPLVAQRRAEGPHWVVAGKGQLLAARQRGWQTIAVAVHDLDDATAEAFIAADNRTAALGTSNDAELAKLLTHLAESDNLAGTGYDGDDLDQLMADLGRELDADAAVQDPGAPPAGADDQGMDVASQYAVAVLCSSEAHQREVFTQLSGMGMAVKVLAV